MKFIILSNDVNNTNNLLESMYKFSNINGKKRDIRCLRTMQDITELSHHPDVAVYSCDIKKNARSALYTIRDMIYDSEETICLLSDHYIFTKNPPSCTNHIGRVLKSRPNDITLFSYSKGLPYEVPNENVCGPLFCYNRQLSTSMHQNIEDIFSFSGFVYRPSTLNRIIEHYLNSGDCRSSLGEVLKIYNSPNFFDFEEPNTMCFAEPCLQRISE